MVESPTWCHYRVLVHFLTCVNRTRKSRKNVLLILPQNIQQPVVTFFVSGLHKAKKYIYTFTRKRWKVVLSLQAGNMSHFLASSSPIALAQRRGLSSPDLHGHVSLYTKHPYPVKVFWLLVLRYLLPSILFLLICGKISARSYRVHVLYIVTTPVLVPLLKSDFRSVFGSIFPKKMQAKGVWKLGSEANILAKEW